MGSPLYGCGSVELGYVPVKMVMGSSPESYCRVSTAAEYDYDRSIDSLLVQSRLPRNYSIDRPNPVVKLQ